MRPFLLLNNTYKIVGYALLTLFLSSRGDCTEFPKREKHLFQRLRRLPAGIYGGRRVVLYYPREGTYPLFYLKNDKLLSAIDAPGLERVVFGQKPELTTSLKCWRIFAAGLSLPEFARNDWCQKAYKEARSEVLSLKKQAGSLDPLKVSRELIKKYGRVLGRDAFFSYLGQLDSSKQFSSLATQSLEERVVLASRTRFSFPDSLMSLQLADRQRLGVILVPGYGTNSDRYRLMMKKMSLELSGFGFRSFFCETQKNRGAAQNNPILGKCLRSALNSGVGSLILVSISKGTSDLLHYFLDPSFGMTFSKLERSKIKAIFSMSGVVRSSVMGWYLSESPSMLGRTLGAFHWLTQKSGERSLDGLRSVSDDLFESIPAAKLKRSLSSAVWISLVAFAEGPLGEVKQEKMFSFGEKIFPTDKYLVSNIDGVMESGAAILPPTTRIPQLLVRLYGSHHAFDGHYLDGSPVSKKYYPELPDDRFHEPGFELLENFFKAIPASLLFSPKELR